MTHMWWSQNLSSGTKFKNYDGLEIEPTPKKIWLENMITRTKLFESNWKMSDYKMCEHTVLDKM